MMKKYILTLLLCSLTIAPVFAQKESDRWIEVGKTKENDVFYIAYEMIDEKETQASFWTKFVYGNVKPKIEKKMVRERVDLISFDFENKKFKTENSFFYDFKGNQVLKKSGDYNFQIIVPETIVENLYNYAERIKFYAIELQKDREDSLILMLNSGDSLFSADSFEKSLELYIYAKNLKGLIENSKPKKIYNDEFSNEEEEEVYNKLKITEKDIDDKIIQTKAEIEKGKRYKELIDNARKTLILDTLQAIGYLEQANIIIYRQEVSNRIQELKDGIITNKINVLIAQANSVLRTDTLIAIENLEKAYELRVNAFLRKRIDDLKELYRINKLRSRLLVDKSNFNIEKTKLLEQDSIIKNITLKDKNHFKDAYIIYYNDLLQKAVSYRTVESYFGVGNHIIEKDSRQIDYLINSYYSELQILFNLQTFILTQDKDNLKKLNKKLKKITLIDEIKKVITI